LDIAATDQIRPIATTTAIPMRIWIPSASVELGSTQCSIFSWGAAQTALDEVVERPCQASEPPSGVAPITTVSEIAVEPMAAKLLGVEPTRAVVIEDAISGVEAGSNGKFGLVIGVARKGNAEELKHHGAQLVVDDLGELVD
jgi:hypothetical protein